jgi:alpha-glucuronidase
MKRLEFQAGHAIVWRDAITEWFTKMSGISDEKQRVGNYPGRIEAESMKLEGYTTVDVTPWETASSGKAVICPESECAAQITWDKPDGWYDVTVQYFDLLHGHSHFSLSVEGHEIEGWDADDTLPSDKLNGHTSARRVLTHVAIHRDDTIRVTGRPGGTEPAPLDYLEILPVHAHSATDASHGIAATQHEKP